MRTIMTTTLLVAGLLTLALALPRAVLAAGNDVKAAEDMFTVMDANKDGALTKDEFAAHGMANDFATYDRNGDGRVTREEYAATEAAAAKGNKPGM